MADQEIQYGPFMFTPPGGGPAKPKSEFTREELLWLLRTTHEGEHRYTLHVWQIQYAFRPLVQETIDNPESEISGEHVLLQESTNKTVPMYFLESAEAGVVINVFENYIYRRWFRPYRSEITTNQFLCRFIMPQDVYSRLSSPDGGPPSDATIRTLSTFNGILCAKVELEHQRCVAEAVKQEREPITANNSYPTRVPWHEAHLLRPLFRALMAIICCADYDRENSTTAGRFPVYLVRTGVEDGLSAPISSDTELATQRMKYFSENVVGTTLEAAVDFIMGLEAREAAVFGIQPDPASIVVPPRDQDGRELTRLPSTQWVSDEKAAEWGWGGRGRMWDEVRCPRFEQRALHSYKVYLYEEQMLKEGRELPATVTIDGHIAVFRT
ncbi:hypothetical protein B0I37DRAFT_381620 [Chaetomium sp. MPI-CAGE-AT-0009]|nr:hypothetical protein B0I37DRAFT_381620 [Chaetomium sp. MPI-CAGE-AT-0009]